MEARLLARDLGHHTDVGALGPFPVKELRARVHLLARVLGHFPVNALFISEGPTPLMQPHLRDWNFSIMTIVRTIFVCEIGSKA